MAALKVTFTLDSETVNRLEHAADRLAVAKSEVVREAIAEFYKQLGRLSDRQKSALLRTFDEVVPRITPRSADEVNRELAEIRQARKSLGRRTPAEPK